MEHAQEMLDRIAEAPITIKEAVIKSNAFEIETK